MNGGYETVIGLEVHVQLRTRSKIFSACPVLPGASPNVAVDEVTLGLPGVLPVLNRAAVDMAIAVGIATNCTIRKKSRFARKHYFYPDLPKGYQISQYDEPLCEYGHLDFELESGESRRVRILRIHMEEDAGKSIHDAARGESLVDYNRAGVPLVEIVSEPDLRSPEEAAAYLKALHAIVVFLEVSDGNMEMGNFRCDANISLRPHGAETLGTKAEIKNMNSFRHVARALAYEEKRQARILDGGGRVVQETRLWDDAAGKTEPMRSKEEAHDYRYFPDPDLLPLHIDAAWLERVASTLPELPATKRQRYQDTLGLSAYDAAVLTGSPALARYYEALLGMAPSDPKRAANWVCTELLGALSRDGRDIAESPVIPEALGAILDAIDAGTISGKMAKDVFEHVYSTGEAPARVIEAMGGQITDAIAIEAVAARVLADNPESVAQYRGGKTKLLGFFVGQVMRQTRGKANPQLVNDVLERLLG